MAAGARRSPRGAERGLTAVSLRAWPERFPPGTGDDFVSNEVIVQGLTAARVRHFLTDTSEWEGYYDNVAGISFPRGGGPRREADLVLRFGTFGFPAPRRARRRVPGSRRRRPRPAVWTVQQDGGPEERLHVLHAWLVEDPPAGRGRVLTQETQHGRPAAAPAQERPDPKPSGHQARLDGLVSAAAK
ncbi:SRPBCC domain-containing protein [Streptomyces griseoruber]|uniref:SRPBCC domain-containing protein n=1 Tax=Streptomyces griseoruber TaxID=1943 RepID=UPI003791BCAC